MTALLGPILTVSYDPERMNALKALFGGDRYLTVPASNLERALEDVQRGNFRLALLGGSVPPEDKRTITELARRRHPHICIIWSLQPGENVSGSELANRVVYSGDADALLSAIDELLLVA